MARMHARPLLVAPLLALALGAALGVTACEAGDCDAWQDAQTIDLGVGDDLYAIATYDPDPTRRFFAVGAGGTIVESQDGVVTVHRPVTSELRAVVIAFETVWAVGDRGTLVRRPVDGGDWQVIDLGLTTSLRAIASDGATIVAVGDDIVLVHDRDTDAWTEAPYPGGGWGDLRVVTTNGGSFHAFGLAGAAWTALIDTRDPWEPLLELTTADLLAGTDSLVVGAGGTVLRLSLTGSWNLEPLEGDVRPDFVAVADENTALSADGRVFSLFNGITELIGFGDGFTAVAGDDYYGGDRSLLAVGLGGRAVARDYDACD